MEFSLPTYSITPSAHPVKCPPQCPVTPTACPPPLPLPLVGFPELGVSHVLSPSLIFSLIFSPFPFIPFHYCLYSPNEWDHIMFVLLQLTYFTQHNTLQFHPRRSTPWVFVISNGWGISHCTHRPQLLHPSSVDGHRGSSHSLATVDIAAVNIGVKTHFFDLEVSFQERNQRANPSLLAAVSTYKNHECAHREQGEPQNQE